MLTGRRLRNDLPRRKPSNPTSSFALLSLPPSFSPLAKLTLPSFSFSDLSTLFNPVSPYPSSLLSPAPFYPYLSIHPSVLRKRQRLAEATPLTAGEEAFVLVIEEGRARAEYPWVTGGRVEEMGRAVVGVLEGWEGL